MEVLIKGDGKMNKLLHLLRVESRELATLFEKARVEGHGTPQEVADRNEEAVRHFFSRYFPFPYRVVKGNIIDSYGGNSNSIDCIILNPAHPYTVNNDDEKASVIMADGVDYAVEVKSKLNSKSEIVRALKQIQSVKKLKRVRDGILFKDRANEEQKLCAKTIPSFIFADSTYSDIEKLIRIIADYYIENKIPLVEQVDMIIVNGRVLIYNVRHNCYAEVTKQRTICYYEGGGDALGLFLYEMNKISQSSPLLSQNVLDLYLDGARPCSLQCFPSIDNELVRNGV
ncbi:MAG: hypothetical protein IJK17_06465 [Lachnospiraceae bacterium]|nr:hypothetical protein [Lachnospiraceae bacterium]